jgi:hypothetical protein
MEDFRGPSTGAGGDLPAEVEESEVFVGLVGHLHGSSPEGSDLSFTEIEYEIEVEK